MAAFLHALSRAFPAADRAGPTDYEIHLARSGRGAIAIALGWLAFYALAVASELISYFH